MAVYNVIDLFCGCGGFSEGFKNAGCNITLGIDKWEPALETYKHNFPQASVRNFDLSQIDSKSILQDVNIKVQDIDIIVGGPPCQGFSVSGKRLVDDPRNKLYKSFVDMVEYVKPKVFVMENVPGLVRLFGGKVKEEVINDFSELGYNVSVQIISSDEYGVPQKRKRVFFIGLNQNKLHNTKRFDFPTPTHGDSDDLLPFVTSRDAISDLDFIGDDEKLDERSEYRLSSKNEYQNKMRKESVSLLNHVTTLHKEETKDIINLVPDGGNYKDLPEHLKETRRVNIAWTRMNSTRPCFTIDTGHNHHFHYRANRVPTVRESARIQSFGDGFRFLGTKTSQLKQVGNAVPPMIAGVLAKKIIDILENE